MRGGGDDDGYCVRSPTNSISSLGYDLVEKLLVAKDDFKLHEPAVSAGGRTEANHFDTRGQENIHVMEKYRPN
ncbi:hypothetical protein PMZ80_007074 [Knufia obscura]|uniref:Uncharacterized protein n=2 Tax=Knufia TaxID=430999 RepID=A0AAN8EVF4_9EURO|nr:hypothetical protein PMZ80_007074 [Knufia obscura]KAK5953083.1 hypothetical protein OHC33_005651 [Knufia fluminis]